MQTLYPSLFSSVKRVLVVECSQPVVILYHFGFFFLNKSDVPCVPYNLLQSWKDYNVLKDTCALIELEKKSVVNNHGDHAIFFFDVTGFKTISEKNVLSFQDLVENRIIL